MLSPTSPAITAAPASPTTTGVALAAAAPAPNRAPSNTHHTANPEPHHAKAKVSPASVRVWMCGARPGGDGSTPPALVRFGLARNGLVALVGDCLPAGFLRPVCRLIGA